MLSIQRILVPTDFSPAAVHAEKQARAVAKLFGAEVHILHVTPDASLPALPGPRVNNQTGESRPRFRHILAWMTDEEQSMRSHSGQRIEVKRVVQESDIPSRAILRYAEAERIDMVIMGTTGKHSGRGPLLGSVVDRVVRLASCPVVTVRPDTQTSGPPRSLSTDRPDERVLVVPVDLASTPPALLRQAKHWAATFHASLDIVHVIQQSGWQRVQASAGLQAEGGHHHIAEALERRDRLKTMVEETQGPDVPVATRVLFGQVGETIAAYAAAQEARFLLMATGHASGLKTYVLGGVTDYLLRHARCPIATLPMDNDALRLPTEAGAASEKASRTSAVTSASPDPLVSSKNADPLEDVSSSVQALQHALDLVSHPFTWPAQS
jgi:nucleotide-binding universal stress UspA family protein